MTVRKSSGKEKKTPSKNMRKTGVPVRKKAKVSEDIALKAMRTHKALRGKIGIVPKAKVSNKVAGKNPRRANTAYHALAAWPLLRMKRSRLASNDLVGSMRR